MHTNAGLISSDAPANVAPTFQPMNSGPGGWDAQRIRLEKRFAKSEAKQQSDEANEYWKREAAKNEKILEDASIIVGDYVPPN